MHAVLEFMDEAEMIMLSVIHRPLDIMSRRHVQRIRCCIFCRSTRQYHEIERTLPSSQATR